VEEAVREELSVRRTLSFNRVNHTKKATISRRILPVLPKTGIDFMSPFLFKTAILSRLSAYISNQPVAFTTQKP